MTQTLVHTSVGSLAVRVVGSGPPAVLWHSLFMDERSWERVERDLAEQRRLVSITGPGHGQSSDADYRYSMEDCARAAAAVLDSLDIGEPVDWVGNAWGGHVGIIFAATWPARCRTLITIGTPVQAYDTRGRLETMVLLVLFRLVGPAQFIVKGVIDTMVSPTTRASDPDAVRLVRDGLVNADRAGLANAVNSISLHRRDLSLLLPQVTAPTLFITGADHKGWTPQQARDYSQLLPNGSAAIVADAAYLPPWRRHRKQCGSSVSSGPPTTDHVGVETISATPTPSPPGRGRVRQRSFNTTRSRPASAVRVGRRP